MNIALSPEMQRFVEEKVKAGYFTSPSEVIDSALNVLKESEALTPEALDELRREVRVGLEELERGEGQPWDAEEIKARVREQAARARETP
jgi:antitoxin ParD1/3/4